MKHFCIVSFCNIYYLPYAKYYIDTIVENGDKCTLLFWNRDGEDGEKDEYGDCSLITYNQRHTNSGSKKSQIKGYVYSSLLFNKTLLNNTFDGIVFLQTHAAIACIVPLLKRYVGKYIVDIRDYTLENFNFYKRLERLIIENSSFSVISSPAYKEFLPKSNYVVSHNYSPFSWEENMINQRMKMNRTEKPIQISFVGTIRFLEMDKKLLNMFANDYRFQLNYFGLGSDVLEEYCNQENIRNVSFHGSFSPEKTTAFYNQTDLINNLYGNNSPYLDYALSNKLYHCIQLKLPILVCPNTYMATVINKYNLGYVLDIDDPSSPDKLFLWFSHLDFDQFSQGCKRLLDSVKQDNMIFENKVKSFVDES